MLGANSVVTKFHHQDGLLCHLGHLCVPSSERAKPVWEAHYNRVAGHFGVEKTVAVLQKHFYWPKLRQDVGKYMRSCTACAIAKPKNITAEATSKILFERVWVHLGIPQTIVSHRDSRFLSTFWSILWSLLDTKLTKSTTFHPQTDGQTEVVNRMIVHILRIYNSKHPRTWDESIPYVQHSYNQALHSSTGHNPFQVGLGFQPLGPMDLSLPLATTSTDSSPAPPEADKATRFIEQIHHVREQVQDIL
jgi:hypothetical protein